MVVILSHSFAASLLFYVWIMFIDDKYAGFRCIYHALKKKKTKTRNSAILSDKI